METGGEALHLATGCGRKEVAMYLVYRGGSKTLKNKSGRLPASLAAELR